MVHQFVLLIAVASAAIVLQPNGVEGGCLTVLAPCMLYPLDVANFTCGGTVNIALTKTAPRIASSSVCTQPDARYTLLMIDPDAPAYGCPTYGNIKHWMVTNIAGDILLNGSDNITQEANVNVYQTYRPPAPPMGIHRYQFLLFEEPVACPNCGEECEVVDTQPENYWTFDVTKFAAKNQLRLVAGFEFLVNSGKPENCTKN